MSRVETSVRSAPAFETAWPRLLWFLSVENRYLAPVLVTGVLLAGQLSFGILESYSKTATAIVSAILTSLVLGRLVGGEQLDDERSTLLAYLCRELYPMDVAVQRQRCLVRPRVRFAVHCGLLLRGAMNQSYREMPVHTRAVHRAAL